MRASDEALDLPALESYVSKAKHGGLEWWEVPRGKCNSGKLFPLLDVASAGNGPVLPSGCGGLGYVVKFANRPFAVEVIRKVAGGFLYEGGEAGGVL